MHALLTKWMLYAHQHMQRSATILTMTVMDSSMTLQAVTPQSVQPAPIVATATVLFVPTARVGSVMTTPNALRQTSVTEAAVYLASSAQTLGAMKSLIVFAGRHPTVVQLIVVGAKIPLTVS